MMEAELMWQNAAWKAREMSVADPNNAYAWFNLGSSLTFLAELTGDDDLFHSAAAAFDEAFTIGLPWRMLWYQFKPYVAYLASGRIDDVLSLTEVTLTNHGGQEVEETYLYRGHALLASGEIERAKDAYSRASRLNPNFVQANQALEELEAMD
jgi:tetratricopeptide (TPR) repeat protein